MPVLSSPASAQIDTDVLIIGAGAAGLRTAIELTRRGHRCLVIGKRKHGDAHTTWAAGGINASLGTRDPEDRWQIHAADTLREGHFICDPLAVELLCRNAPERVLELREWGCAFSETPEGEIDQRYFGAQSFRRTCFVGDTTGEAMLSTLVRQAEALGVAYQQDIFITRVLTERGRAVGAAGLDLSGGSAIAYRAAAVVIAAGGATSLYRRTSSRADENTGDAMALALDAGAGLRDMEFIQFHPTGMIWPADMEGRLVTDAVRGEGGRLFNVQKERFMERYSPDQMELDARDVVARALYEEIQEGRGTERGGVYLDISHQEPDFIRERLPQMYAQFMEHGIDITRSPMEVAPTAHYVMGGIRVDFSTGATSTPGLFAVGEATGGVHGANRLGGNSLAETVVFGQITGAHIADLLDSGELRINDDGAAALAEREFQRLAELRDQSGSSDARALIGELREILWRHAGIVRSEDALREGLRRLDEVKERIPTLDVGPDRVVDALNLVMMHGTAETILRGALLRDESRGAHFRKDARETSDDWQRTIVFTRAEGGEIEATFEPVPVPSATVQEALDEDHHLDYHYLE